MKHVTLGMLERFTNRAIMLKGQKAFDAWWLNWMKTAPYIGRRAEIKALRDFMSPKRNHAARTEERRRRDVVRRMSSLGRIAWVDESATFPTRKEVNAGQYRAQLRASGQSEAFNVFMSRKLGIEVTP